MVDIPSSPVALPSSATTTTSTHKGKEQVFDPNILFDKPAQWVGFNIQLLINKKPQASILIRLPIESHTN